MAHPVSMMNLIASTLTLIALTISLTSGQFTTRHSAVAGCGLNKTCYATPPDCLTNSWTSCSMLFTASPDPVNKLIRMELHGKFNKNPSPEWFAIAFSNDRSMGDDAVFECLFENSGTVTLRQSYNNGKTNKVINDGKGSSNIITGYNEDQIYCSWMQSSPIVMKESTFNILNDSYYFLLARGLFSRSTQKSYHDFRTSSSDPIDLRVTSVASESLAEQVPVSYIRYHGSLMVISWLAIVSIGIIFARYFKESFPNSLVCGVKFWFAIHRTFMVAAVICVSVASYLSFKYVGGWSGPRLHPILGVTSISLMLLQVISALLRCSPDSPSRFIFNWVHFLSGNCAHISAIAAIFTAYDAFTLPPIFLYFVGAYVALHVVIHIVMQAQSICRASSSTESEGKLLLFTLKPLFTLLLSFHPPQSTDNLICFFPNSGSIDIGINESMQRFHIEPKKEDVS